MENGYVGDKEYGVRWQEFNKANQVILKQKIFRSEKSMEKFVDKLIMKDNFYRIVAYC